MTDFRRLGDLPELAPEPGQADAALRTVHRRRRRSAVRTVSAAGALAMAAVFMTSFGPSRSTLEQTDEGVARTATAVPSATGHGGEAESSTGPRLATGSAGTTEAPPSSSAQPGSGPSGVPSPVAPPTSPPPDSPPPRPRQPVQRSENNAIAERVDGPRPCTPGPGTGSWCGGALPEYVSDDEILFLVSVCSGHEGFELTFDSEQEVDAVVRDRDGDEVWHWARGQTFGPDRHKIVLDTEECVSWRIPWDYRDDHGNRPPAGRYLAELPILTTEGDAFATWFSID